MMKSFTRILGVFAGLAIVAASPAAAQEERPQAQASGSGIFKVIDDEGTPKFRTFAFQARRDNRGNSSGMMEVHNREQGTRTHYRVNCLHVDGNQATLSGVVESTTSTAWAAGDPFWVRVVDHGEGANGKADEITLVTIFPAGFPESLVPSCTGENSFSQGLKPIDSGNVQVRQ